MAADPFVAPTLDDVPRQEPNLAPGVHMPAARPWVPDRPGDSVSYGQPHGPLFGDPGPNIGYALMLAHRLEDRLHLAPTERLEDAVAVVSELAMKRAASYGRAPVMADLDATVAWAGAVRRARTSGSRRAASASTKLGTGAARLARSRSTISSLAVW